MHGPCVVSGIVNKLLVDIILVGKLDTHVNVWPGHQIKGKTSSNRCRTYSSNEGEQPFFVEKLACFFPELMCFLYQFMICHITHAGSPSLIAVRRTSQMCIPYDGENRETRTEGLSSVRRVTNHSVQDHQWGLQGVQKAILSRFCSLSITSVILSFPQYKGLDTSKTEGQVKKST